MRILQIGPLPPEVGGQTIGGIASHVWHLSENLVERGHEVAVFASNVRSVSVQPVVNHGVKIYGKRKPLHTILSNRLLNPCFGSKVYRTKRHFGLLQSWPKVVQRLLDYERVVRAFQPEVIHIHPLELRFPYAHFTIEGKIPLIASIHSTHFIDFSEPSVRPLKYQLVKQGLGAAQNLICVSRHVRERVEILFPAALEGKNTWIVYNPIDASLFSPVPMEKARALIKHPMGKPLILFVGNLIPRKGPHLLMEAFLELKKRNSNARLVIVGDGPQKKELQQMIEEHDLRAHVSLEGPKSQAELANYYSAADVFVLPSASEGFALVFLEAISCGCPFIGTRGVVDELIFSEDYAFTVPPNDRVMLSHIIEKALHHSWNREKIRNYAVQFDWAAKVHEFEKVYQTITGIHGDKRNLSINSGERAR